MLIEHVLIYCIFINITISVVNPWDPDPNSDTALN